MKSLYPVAMLAGLLTTGLPAPVRADVSSSPAPPAPPPAPSAPSSSDPATGGKPAPTAPAPTAPAPAAPPKEEAKPADPRDQQIEELRKVIDALQRRVEELEKRPASAPAPPPATEPAPAPETPPAPAPAGGGGATFIPNISAIGNLILGGGDSRRVPNRGRFNFEEFEIAFQDAVAPNLRYDVFLAAEKGEEWKLGLEEGYLTASALYPGLNARVGRIRAPFGKFNPLHAHVWPFITQPSAETALLGPDGLISDGAVLEYTFPTKGFFVRGELGGWQTTSETEDGLGFAAGNLGAYSGRLWLGKQIGRDRELELGFSRYQGRGDVEGFGHRREALTGVDLTYRAFPGGYRRLKAAAELINHETSIPGGTRNSLGGFAYLAYRMNQFWEVGVRGDYTRFPFPEKSYDWGGSLFLTKYLTEVTSLRLEYQYSRSPLLGSGNGIYFQVLFGSGPHTHQLQ